MASLLGGFSGMPDGGQFGPATDQAHGLNVNVEVYSSLEGYVRVRGSSDQTVLLSRLSGEELDLVRAVPEAKYSVASLHLWRAGLVR